MLTSYIYGEFPKGKGNLGTKKIGNEQRIKQSQDQWRNWRPSLLQVYPCLSYILELLKCENTTEVFLISAKMLILLITASSKLFYFSTHHWFFFSDEEYPELPPLPLSPLPPSFDSCQSNGTIITAQLSDEHEQNPLATKSSYTQKKCAAYLGNDSIGYTSTDRESPNSQGFVVSEKPPKQDIPDSNAADRSFEEAQPLNVHQDIQSDIVPLFTSASSISISPTFISNIQDATKEKEVNDSECSTVEGFSSVDTNLTKRELEKVVDRIVQDIYTGKYRFDHVYHPNREAKGWFKMKGVHLIDINKITEKWHVVVQH